VLDLVGKPNLLVTKTAFEILLEEISHPPIITMSQKLDDLLDGGVRLSKLTEVAGVAGIGKTQIW